MVDEIEKNKDLTDRLVDDATFATLMELSLSRTTEPEDQEIINRVASELNQTLSKRTQKKNKDIKRGGLADFLSTLNYRQFLAIAATTCLIFGVASSLYLSSGDSEIYEGVKGEAAGNATIPLTLSIKEHKTNKALDSAVVAPNTVLVFTVIADESGFYSLLKFTRNTKEVVVPATAIRAGVETMAEVEQGHYGYEVEKGDELTFCAIASKSRAKLLSVSSSVNVKEKLSIPGQCHRLASE